LAPLDAPSNAKMLTGDSDGIWNHLNPAWSPDGTLICYGSFEGLWTIPRSGGHSKQLTHESAALEPAWSSDGRYVYYSSFGGGRGAIWRVPAGGGTPERITTGMSRETHPAVSRDGKRLSYGSGQISNESSLLDRTMGKVSVLSDLQPDYMAALAPDGSSVVFPSNRSGPYFMLWMMSLESDKHPNVPYQLTDQPGTASHPIFSPDGHWIAYYRLKGQSRNLMTIAAHGGQPNQLTDGPAMDTDPSWSSDGSQITFVREEKGHAKIGVARIEQGKMIGSPRWLNINDALADSPVWSPDSRTIAYLASRKKSELWVVPADGSEPPRLVTNGADGKWIRWDPLTGDVLLSARLGHQGVSLYCISPETNMHRPFDPTVEFGGVDASGVFDVSADGRFLVYSRTVSQKGQIWKLEAENGVF